MSAFDQGLLVGLAIGWFYAVGGILFAELLLPLLRDWLRGARCRP